MAGVVKNTRSLARARACSSTRVRPAMLIVQRNVEWFWRDRLAAPADGTRRAFSGSDVVFQLYAGNGWQLQPLANLGTLNALSKKRRITEKTRTWADDLLAARGAPQRRAGLRVPLPVLGRRARLGVGRCRRRSRSRPTRGSGRRAEAREMLEVFRQAPPFGVQFLLEPARAHYLHVPAGAAPADRQRVRAGRAVAAARTSALEPADPAAQEVYAMGLNEARASMAQYDTGAWSLYYHEPGSLRRAGVRPALPPPVPGLPRERCATRIGGEPFCSMADELRPLRDRAGAVRDGADRGDEEADRGARLRVEALVDPRDAVPRRRSRSTRSRWRRSAGTFRVKFTRPREARRVPHRLRRHRADRPAQRDRGRRRSCASGRDRGLPAAPASARVAWSRCGRRRGCPPRCRARAGRDDPPGRRPLPRRRRARLVFARRGVTLRSRSGEARRVVIDGGYEAGAIVHVFADRVTIADVTLDAGARPSRPQLSRPSAARVSPVCGCTALRLVDSGEQFVKVNGNASGSAWVHRGTVACSRFVMTAEGRRNVERAFGCYTGGIDAHGARGWRRARQPVRGHLLRGRRGGRARDPLLERLARHAGGEQRDRRLLARDRVRPPAIAVTPAARSATTRSWATSPSTTAASAWSPRPARASCTTRSSRRRARRTRSPRSTCVSRRPPRSSSTTSRGGSPGATVAARGCAATSRASRAAG